MPIEIEKFKLISRVRIPRECLPDNNIAMTLAIIGSLSINNQPVLNADDYLLFDFHIDIPISVLISFFERWGINVKFYTINNV